MKITERDLVDLVKAKANRLGWPDKADVIINGSSLKAFEEKVMPGLQSIKQTIIEIERRI